MNADDPRAAVQLGLARTDEGADDRATLIAEEKGVLRRLRRDLPHKTSCHFCNYSVLNPCTEAEHVKNCDNY
jgi:hypothetical protein